MYADRIQDEFLFLSIQTKRSDYDLNLILDGDRGPIKIDSTQKVITTLSN